jgi:hypothetical protein
MSSALGVTGPTATVTGFSLAWARALETVIDWLDLGVCDRALLCSADEHHPVVGHAGRQLGGWAPDGRMWPLDLAAPSYVPGESFTALALGRPDEVPATWGLLEAPRFARLLPSAGRAAAPLGSDSVAPRAVLLAASGNPLEAESYSALGRDAPAVGAYGALWGANPTADALTVLAAALMLHDGVLHAPPACERRSQGLSLLEPGALGPGDVLDCAVADAGGRGAIVRVSRAAR